MASCSAMSQHNGTALRVTYRPTLLPGLVALWRGPRTLQLGLDPRHAVVLDLPNPAAAGLLDLLDGSRTERGLLAAAARRGIGEMDARALLATLSRHGLVVGAHALLPRTLGEPVRARLAGEAAALARRPGAARTPADILRTRAAARVRVAGRGRLGVPIAVCLALAGVGHLDVALDGVVEPGELLGTGTGTGTGGRRSTAAIRAIAELAPGTRCTPLPRRADAHVVVQIGPPAGPASLHALAHRRLAYLPVLVRDGAVLVGPLVPPGGKPCLNCLDLYRTDRDPAWPALAAQLATSDTPGPRERVEACAVATGLAATAYVTAEVLRQLDGERPHTLGRTIELTGPGQARRRTWPPHPACHCARRRPRGR